MSWLAAAGALSTATTSTLLAEHWLLLTFALQPIEEPAVMEEKQLNMSLLLYHAARKTAGAPDQRGMGQRGVGTESRQQGKLEISGVQDGEARAGFVRNPPC